LAACAHPRPEPTALAPGVTGPVPGVTVSPVPADSGAAAARVNGDVGSPNALQPAQIAAGPGAALGGIPGESAGANLTGGDVTLDFTDADIRDVVTQILGETLQVSYSIDPAVRGTATFHSARPIPRTRLIPILQSLLAQNNATLVQNGEVFRVAPAASAGIPSFATEDAGAGGAVIPLRYASAEDLAKVLQPVVGAGGRLAADPGHNAIIITGEPQARQALAALVRSFDTDVLAGQSYALLPVPDGDAKDMATTLQDAFKSQTGGALAGLVHVLPLSHANAVLLVTSNPRYLADARRVYALVQRNQNLSQRSWHVYYLQNSRSDDIAYVLQKAFTPHDVTAQPEGSGQNQNGSTGGGLGGLATGSSAAGSGGINSFGGIGSSSGTTGGATGAGGTGSSSGLGGLTLAGAGNTSSTASANPLVGSLEAGGGEEDVNAMRIIPNPQNNAILIYGTQQEDNTVEAMLQKIDLLPLEVRIDATIAEVTLNDQLQFGTQFFFKEGSVNQLLTNATSAATNPPSFASGAPGFIFGATAKGVQATLQALQAVTTVHVLSSPELMVLDNQPASLQVGALVPYLTQQQQSTLTSSLLGNEIVNSIAYQPTGVILQVTPRVNSDGLVTMDVAQEVSSVDSSTSNSIGSPTFDDRVVKSRVVVQDGQTLGLAGLISDSISRGNSGIPYLKDVPILGLLFGTQTNTRARTELLVLITPHVVHDQRDALALTQDLKAQLLNAAAVPDESQTLEPSGSADPSARLRQRLGLQP
jgi:general secretion pathway protein D